MTSAALAISGGGHRASLYGLGVLLYLADVGKNADVVSISSVSGGSITNAYVGLRGDYPQQTRDEFRSVAGTLASQIANRGTLFAWAGTKLYLAALVVVGLATFSVWLLPWHWLVRLALFLVALAVWEVALLRRRGEICGRAYAATVFAKGSPPTLSAIARDDIDHIICATHLNAGEHMYFSGKFAYAYRFGWGAPGDLPLHAAVQASTALPGAFPPRWMRSARFGFSGAADHVPRSIGLVDGGVYDNMADQWLSGLGRRRGVPDHVQRPDVIILANASASMGMQGVGSMKSPLVGEIAALMRDSSIMYDNSASIRKSDLIDRFDAHAAGPPAQQFGEQGALLDIASDPFGAAEYFADKDAAWPDRAARARAVLTKKPAAWNSDSGWAAVVPTNLNKLGVDTAARLLHHAYTLAAMNLHVFLDFPLVQVPQLSDFEDLCSS